jgi:hypothetical protein
MKQIDPRVNRNLHQLAADIYNSIEHEDTDTPAIELLENYGKWVWNKALELAAKNAKLKGYRYNAITQQSSQIEGEDCYWEGHPEDQPCPDLTIEVDKESILKLKIP